MSFTEAQIEAARAVIRADQAIDLSARVIRAAMEAAERAAWQDISTAPTDGTSVLVVAPTWTKARIAQYDGQKYHKKPRPYWRCIGIYSAAECRESPPTHFRPLPAPPEGTPA